jgi:hypothetical protein
VNCSLNEIWSLLHKAVRGAGFPPGHASVVSAAGVWMAQRGFPVCEIIARAVAIGMREPNFDCLDGHIRFCDARAAIDGVAAIDHVLATEPGTQAALVNIDEFALLLGLVGSAAQEHNVCFTISVGSDEYLVEPGCALGPENLTALGENCIKLSRISERVEALTLPKLSSRYDPASTSDAGWDRLTEFANRTYVPASVQSRLRGAGAGLTDND